MQAARIRPAGGLLSCPCLLPHQAKRPTGTRRAPPAPHDRCSALWTIRVLAPLTLFGNRDIKEPQARKRAPGPRQPSVARTPPKGDASRFECPSGLALFRASRVSGRMLRGRAAPLPCGRGSVSTCRLRGSPHLRHMAGAGCLPGNAPLALVRLLQSIVSVGPLPQMTLNWPFGG
jgi:hypothetical protein